MTLSMTTNTLDWHTSRSVHRRRFVCFTYPTQRWKKTAAATTKKDRSSRKHIGIWLNRENWCAHFFNDFWIMSHTRANTRRECQTHHHKFLPLSLMLSSNLSLSLLEAEKCSIWCAACKWNGNGKKPRVCIQIVCVDENEMEREKKKWWMNEAVNRKNTMAQIIFFPLRSIILQKMSIDSVLMSCYANTFPRTRWLATCDANTISKSRSTHQRQLDAGEKV